MENFKIQFFKFIIAFHLIAIKLILIQAEVEIIYEDVEIVVESEEYFKDVDIHVNDDNSAIFINVTIIKRFPDDTRVQSELIASSMGQYVVRTPINMNVEVCQLFDTEHTELYGTQLETFGFSRDDCPPSPGTYYNIQYTMDKSSLPDDIPSNKYLVTSKLTIGNIDILKGHSYIRIMS